MYLQSLKRLDNADHSTNNKNIKTSNNERVKVMKINVRNMQRVLHIHVFGDRINGRDVCDSCPYRAPRHHIISAFGNDVVTIRIEDKNFEKKFVLAATVPSMTVPELKERILKRNPEFKGISKMRKPELVSTLVGMVK